MVELISSHDKPIVIASMGRCGSSMIFRSSSRSTLKLKTGIKRVDNRIAELIKRPAWHLESKELKKGMVYKTHDYPNSIKRGSDVRLVYLYGCPYQVIASTIRNTKEKGSGWLEMHSKKLKSPVKSWNDLVNRDALNLERHFDEWSDLIGDRCLAIHYENIWENKGLISSHIGVDIKLPSRRQRNSSINELKKEHVRKIKKVYNSLKKKVEELKR